jgi:hypothetical protein
MERQPKYPYDKTKQAQVLKAVAEIESLEASNSLKHRMKANIFRKHNGS